MRVWASLILFAAIVGIICGACSPDSPCDNVASGQSSSSVESNPSGALDQYFTCDMDGTLTPITDMEGFIGCDGISDYTANVTWTIIGPDIYSFYDLQLSFVHLNVADGTIYIYDGSALIDTVSGSFDPPPSTVYTCYTGTFYVVYKVGVYFAPAEMDPELYSFKMYYSWYDPYEDPVPISGGKSSPLAVVTDPVRYGGDAVIDCSTSQEIIVTGIPAGRFGCRGYAKGVVITWRIDTEIKGSKHTSLQDMNTWVFPEYTVTAYSGLDTDEASIIQPDKDGFGFANGAQVTIVFDSTSGRLNDAAVDKRVNLEPPVPGFMGWFSHYREGDKLPGYCPRYRV